MMKYRIALMCALFFLVTGTSHAYVTRAQDAFTVNGKVGVYTIDFVLGHGSHTVTVPMHAARGTADARPDTLTYEVETGEGITTSGSSYGIVLGNVPMRDGVYVVPKGQRGAFTLLVLYTRDATLPDRYRVHVTGLPFTFDGSQKLGLNEHELARYVTPLLSLMDVTVRVR